ncbi:MAG: hypothetical protein M0Q51_11990, partial [Bacteroidales bacterium]|nr:hypothetical protein [Bacteroidales bacterium]
MKISMAQNEANIWYFSKHCGLDFNSGIPVVLHDGQTHWDLGCATISDSLGNLLFYTATQQVYNKNHDIMLNGSDLIQPGVFGRAIVKWPGQNEIYYVFTTEHPEAYTGFYYSIVDLKLENGLGAVTEKDIPVESGWDAADRIAIVKQENSGNVWVITRKYTEDAIAAYMVDENGFNPNPVLSEMPDRQASVWEWGFLKISYDKRFLFSSYQTDKEIEVCNFNSSTGKSEYMYSLIEPGGVQWIIAGMELSPDSKYLYISYNKSGDTNVIYQFEMQYITDKDLFNSSAMLVGSGAATCMQLARDGKIYCSGPPELNYHYVSVIHNPWVRGVGCMYESNALFMSPGEVMISLPNILLDYLYRFEWEADDYCQGSAVHFLPHFVPTPDSVEWFFDEFATGNYSNELSPTYTFQNAGIHEVEVDIWYPTGRFEHTSREIEIYPTPHPDLGPDLLICEGTAVTLNANCAADLYSWSTSQFGSSEIVV